MLIAIYSIILASKNTATCVFIDEPDNYISIEEIQPWLQLFTDDCGQSADFEQITLISHHPEVIDHPCLNTPILFGRDPEAPTRGSVSIFL
jgi:hypothetical protein